MSESKTIIWQPHNLKIIFKMGGLKFYLILLCIYLCLNFQVVESNESGGPLNLLKGFMNKKSKTSETQKKNKSLNLASSSKKDTPTGSPKKKKSDKKVSFSHSHLKNRPVNVFEPLEGQRRFENRHSGILYRNYRSLSDPSDLVSANKSREKLINHRRFADYKSTSPFERPINAPETGDGAESSQTESQTNRRKVPRFNSGYFKKSASKFVKRCRDIFGFPEECNQNNNNRRGNSGLDPSQRVEEVQDDNENYKLEKQPSPPQTFLSDRFGQGSSQSSTSSSGSKSSNDKDSQKPTIPIPEGGYKRTFYRKDEKKKLKQAPPIFERTTSIKTDPRLIILKAGEKMESFRKPKDIEVFGEKYPNVDALARIPPLSEKRLQSSEKLKKEFVTDHDKAIKDEEEELRRRVEELKRGDKPLIKTVKKNTSKTRKKLKKVRKNKKPGFFKRAKDSFVSGFKSKFNLGANERAEPNIMRPLVEGNEASSSSEVSPESGSGQSSSRSGSPSATTSSGSQTGQSSSRSGSPSATASSGSQTGQSSSRSGSPSATASSKSLTGQS